MNFRRNLACLLLLVLSLPLCGQARQQYYTITQVREQAAQRWQQSYTAHGRTIKVDIPIQVPDVQNFPLLSGAFKPISPLLPETFGQNGRDFEAGYAFNSADYFRYDTHSYLELAKLASKAPEPPSRNMDTSMIVKHINQLDLDLPYSWGNPATIREAESVLLAAWSRFFPGEEPLTLMPRSITAYGAYRAYDKTTDDFTGEAWADFEPPLLVFFDQVLLGIPVMGFAVASHTVFAGSMKKEPFTFLGAVAVLQEKKGLGLEPYRSAQFSVLKQSAMLEKDLPLCPLSTVINTYEELINQGQLRSASSLRLGYIAWHKGQDAQSFLLQPTWVLEGELHRKAGSESFSGKGESPDFGMVLINAQTGELIDPWLMDENRASHAPKIILWK